MKKTLFVLGGWLVKKNGIWQTIPVGEMADYALPTNDRLRVEAASLYFKKHPDTAIVVSGGKGKLVPDAPTIASVLKGELMALGVPEESILLEEKSGNTLDQLKMIPTYFFGGNGENVSILSNEWHLPRVKALIEYAEESLKDVLSKVGFLSAEEILTEESEKWRKTVEVARNVPGLSERIALEKKGVEALKNGTYSRK